MAEEYKLTYFNYRGLAEPIRLIFKYAEVPFEDVRLEWDEEWNDTHKSKYPWGNLPVLETGGLKLSQSAAIARFLAKRFNLTGADEFEAAKCDELIDAMTDLRAEWTKLFMEFNPEKKAALKEMFIIKMSYRFEIFNNAFNQNGGKYFVGESLTWADIYIAYFFDFFKVGLESENILKEYPNLQKFQNEIFAIPQIKDWIKIRPKTDF